MAFGPCSPSADPSTDCAVIARCPSNCTRDKLRNEAILNQQNYIWGQGVAGRGRLGFGEGEVALHAPQALIELEYKLMIGIDFLSVSFDEHTVTGNALGILGNHGLGAGEAAIETGEAFAERIELGVQIFEDDAEFTIRCHVWFLEAERALEEGKDIL